MSDVPASETVSTLTFDDLATLLAPLGTLNSPSELHGLLCGKLAGGEQLGEVEWLLDAVEFLDFVSAPDERVRAALSALFHNTRVQLQGELGLQLILPDDDALLGERARALSEWCHGFLSGFGSVDHKGQRDIDEEGRELLEDLAEIVRIEIDEDELVTHAESDFMEVTEYVRMAANSLYFAYAPKPAQEDAAASMMPPSDQIH